MLATQLSEKVGAVFESLGLDKSLGIVGNSDRPDLSDFQCNGAMQAARILKRRPLDIAKEILPALQAIDIFSQVTVDGPGFINFTLSDRYILNALQGDKDANEPKQPPQKIVIDYGGPNVAKPLHVGHLRSAIIGESLKRIARELNHHVISDIHMGDWGTPMGMLIAQLSDDHPEWPFFSDKFTETSAANRPDLSAEDLNNLYPVAAKHFKEDTNFADKAREATAKLQSGHAGYRKLWRHFVDISIESIKKDFGALDVSFDLWLGESDADAISHKVVQNLIAQGVAKESQGALVVEVAQPADKFEVPPLILRKKDGAATYATTDLGTIAQRVEDIKPDKIWYVVDQRQSLHFKQVFRAAAQGCLIKEDSLEHIGFGTVNGKDGKPFKTRDGGVMRLGDLIQNSIELALKEAGFENEQVDEATKEMITMVAIAAIKFGDLSNLRTTDYIFDPKEFVRFDGKTGPYVQYAAVRAGAILEKASANSFTGNPQIEAFTNRTERGLALSLLRFPEALQRAFDKRMPSDLCEYAFDLAQRFNGFYRDCAILSETDPNIRDFRLFLTDQTATTLKKTLECLAIPVPRKMLRAPKMEPSI
jgi:arginyl-tRNA synthetase